MSVSVYSRLAKLLFVVSGFILILQGGAFAAITDTDKALYTVTVNVDKTDKTAALAREKAMLEAEQLAYQTVFSRVTLSEYKGNLPKLSTKDLKNLVNDISIKGERTSAVRYMGTITISLKDELFKEILDNKGIPYINAVSKPVLLIPVIRQDDALVFVPKHEILTLWQNESTQRLVVPVVIPADENGSQDTITDFLSASISVDEVKEVFDISNIYITEILYNSDANNIEFVITDAEHSDKPNLKFTVSTTTGAEKAYKAAFNTIAKHLENDFKIQNIVETSTRYNVSVIFPITNLIEWQQLQKTLPKIHTVDHYELQSISNNDVRLTIYFTRNLTQLITDMRSFGLILTNEEDSDVWYLTKASKYDTDNVNALGSNL